MNLRRAISWPMRAAGLLLATAAVIVAGLCVLAPKGAAGLRTFYRDDSQGVTFFVFDSRKSVDREIAFYDGLNHADFFLTSLSSVVVTSTMSLAIGGALLWLGCRLRSF